MVLRPILAGVIWLVASASFAADDPNKPFDIKNRIAMLRTLVGEPGLIREVLGKLKDRVEADLPSSMVDEKALDQVQKDTTTLNRMVPDPLPAIDTPKSIESLRAKGAAAGTLIGSQEELRSLRRAADNRAGEIDDLKKQRDEASQLADKYAKDAETAQQLAREIGDKALTPEIIIIGRVTGRSVDLSWADMETELVPALFKRQEAAKAVVSRYSSVIDSAEKDLAGFRDALTFGAWIFSGDSTADGVANLDPRNLPGVSADNIARLHQEMVDSTHKSLEIANQMRQEAADIRRHNAEISKYQEMLGAVSSGISMADSLSGSAHNGQSPQVKVIYNKVEYKWETTIVNGSVPIHRH